MDPRSDGVDEEELERRIREFELQVCRSVVEAVGAEWNPPPRERWLQLVVLPSFEHELVFTVTETNRGSSVMAHTAQCSVWLFLMAADDDAEPVSPTPIAAEARLPEADAERIWSTARLVVPPPPVLGLDGITFRLRTRFEQEIGDVEVWSPRRSSPVFELYEMLLHSLAVADDHPVTAADGIIRRVYFP